MATSTKEAQAAIVAAALATYVARVVKALAAALVVMLTTAYLEAHAGIGLALGYVESLAAVVTARALIPRR